LPVLLANTRFVLEPDFYSFTSWQMSCVSVQRVVEVFLADIPHLNFTIGVILHKLHRLAKICFLQTPDTSDFDELATF